MSVENGLLYFLKSRLALHVFFSISFFVAWFLLIAVSENSMEKLPIGFIAAGYYLAASYTGRWIIKRWQEANNFYTFIMMLFGSIVILAIVGALGMGVLFRPNIYTEFGRSFAICVPIVILFMAFGMFLTTARTSLLNQIQSANIKQVNKERELDFLRSQLSPHFLFNTLNNIYGLAITKPAIMPPLILKLSDLLRYSIYDTSRTFVPLNEELDYIRNYIELERLRLGERLSLSVALASASVNIAPMLLMTFIENAFKHATDTTDNKIWIDMTLAFEKNTLSFSIMNSCSDVPRQSLVSGQSSGVGIANAKKRLDLLYPKRYTLNHFRKDNQYYVHLTIDMNE